MHVVVASVLGSINCLFSMSSSNTLIVQQTAVDSRRPSTPNLGPRTPVLHDEGHCTAGEYP